MRKLMLVLALAALGAGLLVGEGKVESTGAWKPTKPITVIVPWGAGGSTDQVTRVAAGELEEALGQKVVIVNQPGASGSVGTKSVLDAAPDGYTWAAGAAADLGGYKVLGLLDTTWDDWILFLTVANVSVISVNADAPYKDIPELFAALQKMGAQIPVATAGVSSAGHNAIESVRKFIKFDYKHVTYDGGNPAVIATVAGEAVVTTQLAVEQADMIAGGKLRPLAVLDTKPLKLRDKVIPPITNWLPEYKAAPNYFGIWIRKDAPKNVVDTMGQVWDTKIAGSQKLAAYAQERGAVFNPSWGDEAKEAALPMLSMATWNYYDAGKAVMSPEVLKIPRF